MNKIHKRANKGFTLLEILLVIAAIGILAAIVLVAINPNRQIAQVRNAERRSEVNTIYKAIEQYLIDTGSYPAGITTAIQDICINGNTTNCVNLGVLVPDYIANIPIDPQGVAYKVAINGANNRVSVYTSNAELGQVIGVNNTWTPANISTALWLDAADASTITQSSGAITAWADKSGNNRTATAAGNPTYNATGMSTNRPAVQLDGTGDGFVSSITGISSFNALDVYMVTQTTEAAAPDANSAFFWAYGNLGSSSGPYLASQGLALSSSTSVLSGELIIILAENATANAGRLGSNSYARAANTAQILNSRNSTTGTSLLANGSSVTLNLANQITTSSNTAPSAIGYTVDSNFHIGALRANGTLLYSPAIKFGEIIVAPTLLSTNDRQLIEGYLAWKWGLVHNLPANHPYRWDGREFGYTASGITDTDAQTYIAGVETADGQVLENATRTAIQNFIVGAKADGIWNAIKSSAILAGARTLNGALVPLKGTAPTNFNFVSGDYNRKTGLVGNGSTKYLDSNRANNADPQNNSHIAARVSSQAIGVIMASGDNLSPGRNYIDDTGVNGRFACRTSTIFNDNRINANTLVGVARSSSASFNYMLNGLTSSFTSSSGSPDSVNTFIFARSNGGVIQSFSTHRLAFYSIGESLNLALLNTRVTQLMTDLNNAIP